MSRISRRSEKDNFSFLRAHGSPVSTLSFQNHYNKQDNISKYFYHG